MQYIYANIKAILNMKHKNVQIIGNFLVINISFTEPNVNEDLKITKKCLKLFCCQKIPG